MKLAEVIAYCADRLQEQQKRPLLVGVVGDSGSGKSYYSDRLQAELRHRKMNFVYLDYDVFMTPRRNREPLKEKTYTDGEHAGKTYWEVLENWFRLDVFERVIGDLRAGKPTSFYPYERSTGDISKKAQHIEPANLVLFNTAMPY